MPSEDRATHFVYMGDVQDPGIAESKRYFDYLRHAADSIDFFAFAGDQIEGPTDAYWRAWYTSIGSLTRSIPHHRSTRQPRVPEEGLRARTRPPLGTSVRLPYQWAEGLPRAKLLHRYAAPALIVMDTTDIMGLGAINQHKEWLRSALKGSHQLGRSSSSTTP